jgi:hypothetical protein
MACAHGGKSRRRMSAPSHGYSLRPRGGSAPSKPTPRPSSPPPITVQETPTTPPTPSTLTAPSTPPQTTIQVCALLFFLSFNLHPLYSSKFISILSTMLTYSTRIHSFVHARNASIVMLHTALCMQKIIITPTSHSNINTIFL